MVHGVLNPVNAMEMAKRIEPYGILFFEEPVLPENVDAMREIRRTARIPIATGERLFTRYAFKELLVGEAVDVIQADVGNAGGIYEVFKIAAMAEAFYVSVAPHNPWSPLSTAISLHLDAVVQNFLIQELPTALAPPGRARLIKEQIEHPTDGYLGIPSGIGWGVELDEEFVRAHPWNPDSLRKPWLPTGPDGGLVHT
jgi:galactonate dehydratase